MHQFFSDFILRTCSHNLSSNRKLFADEISIFAVTHDINDGIRKEELVFQWKMSFNPDINKKEQ